MSVVCRGHKQRASGGSTASMNEMVTTEQPGAPLRESDLNTRYMYTVYVRFIWQEITIKCTVIYNVCTRFWPTLMLRIALAVVVCGRAMALLSRDGGQFGSCSLWEVLLVGFDLNHQKGYFVMVGSLGAALCGKSCWLALISQKGLLWLLLTPGAIEQ